MRIQGYVYIYIHTYTKTYRHEYWYPFFQRAQVIDKTSTVLNSLGLATLDKLRLTGNELGPEALDTLATQLNPAESAN